MTLSATGALRRCACSPKNELEYEYMKASYKDCRQGYSKRIGRSSVSTPLVKNPEKSNIRAPWSLVSSRAPSLPSIPFTIPEEEPDTITSLEDLGLSTPKYTGEPLVNLTTRIARHWEEASMSDFMKHPLGKDQPFELRKCHKWDDWVDWSDARFQTPERAEKARCMSHKADSPSNLAFDYTSGHATMSTFEPPSTPKHLMSARKAPTPAQFMAPTPSAADADEQNYGSVQRSRNNFDRMLELKKMSPDEGDALIQQLGTDLGRTWHHYDDLADDIRRFNRLEGLYQETGVSKFKTTQVRGGEEFHRGTASVAGPKPPKTYDVPYATYPIDVVLPAGVPRRRSRQISISDISTGIQKYMESITCVVDRPVLNIPSHTNTLSGMNKP